jgi:hypothetical protein
MSVGQSTLQQEIDQNTSKRLYDRVGPAIGIASGVFGSLAILGLTLLPTSTRTQQVLVLIACAGSTVACVTGLGAWQSVRRFALCVISAVIALVSLAGLSVVTEAVRPKSDPRAHADGPSAVVGESPAATGSTGESDRATDSTPIGPTPTSASPKTEAPYKEVYSEKELRLPVGGCFKLDSS